MKFKHWFAFSLLIAGLTQGGCSFLMPSTEMISLTTKPEDAIIILNGTRFEGVPFFAPVAKNDNLLITVYRAKMPTRHYVVRRKLSTTGILDCVGSIAILPAFGLLTGGAWELEENNIMIDLNDLRTNVTEINSITEYEDPDLDKKPDTQSIAPTPEEPVANESVAAEPSTPTAVTVTESVTTTPETAAPVVTESVTVSEVPEAENAEEMTEELPENRQEEQANP